MYGAGVSKDGNLIAPIWTVLALFCLRDAYGAESVHQENEMKKQYHKPGLKALGLLRLVTSVPISSGEQIPPLPPPP